MSCPQDSPEAHLEKVFKVIDRQLETLTYTISESNKKCDPSDSNIAWLFFPNIIDCYNLPRMCEIARLGDYYRIASVLRSLRGFRAAPKFKLGGVRGGLSLSLLAT
jgi:hypothetical protein